MVYITHPAKKLLRCHQKVRGDIPLLMLHIVSEEVGHN